MERMSTDITALKMQYDKLRQRQRQAHVISGAAASAKKAVEVKQKTPAPVLVPKIESPLAMNHLFVGKVQGGRNRLVTDGPRIAPVTAPRNSLLTKQLQAVAAAQAASHAKKSPTRRSPPARPSHPAVQSQQQEENTHGHHSNDREKRCDHGENMDRDAVTAVKEESGSPAGHCQPGCGVGLGGLSEDSVMQDVQCQPACHNNSAPESPNKVAPESPNTSAPDSPNKVAPESPNTSAPDSPNKSAPDFPVISGVLSATMEDNGDDSNSHSSGEEGEAVPCHPSHKDTELEMLSGEGGRAGSSPLCHQGSGSFESKESDSGVNVSSPSPDTSAQSSPEKKPQRPVSIQLWSAQDLSGRGTGDSVVREEAGQGDANFHTHPAVSRSLSMPNGSSPAHLTTLVTTVRTPATTPTRGPPSPVVIPVAQQVSPSSQPPSLPSPVKTNRPFNPFPVKHVNVNRAKTGLKLGLYTPSTLEHIQGQLLGGLAGKKARNVLS